MVSLEDRGLVGLDSVGGRVGPTEGISLKSKEQIPHPFDLRRCPTFVAGGPAEFMTQPFHGGHVLFDETAPKNVGSTGLESGKRLADLENMFLVGDQAKGGAEDRLERGVEAGNGSQPLIPAGELLFFQFIGLS